MRSPARRHLTNRIANRRIRLTFLRVDPIRNADAIYDLLVELADLEEELEAELAQLAANHVGTPSSRKNPPLLKDPHPPFQNYPLPPFQKVTSSMPDEWDDLLLARCQRPIGKCEGSGRRRGCRRMSSRTAAR